jgi:hypothetical protein
MNKKTLDALTASMSNLTTKFTAMTAAMPQNPAGQPQMPQGGFDLSKFIPKIDLPDSAKTALTNIANGLNVAGGALGVNLGLDGDKIAAGITGLLTTMAAYTLATNTLSKVMEDVKDTVKKAFVELGELQAKSLATNINLRDLFEGTKAGNLTVTDSLNLRSSLLDVSKELLNFREAGITKLDKNILNLVDKMVFTGQKTGALASFLTQTSLAANLNAEQASKLAMELSKSSETYSTQLDSLFEIAKSMESINTNLVALVGANIAPELLKAQSSYIDKFGAQYANNIKTIFSMVFDPKNQTAVIAGGFTAQAERLMRGQMTAEQFKEFSKQLATYFDRALGSRASFAQLPAQEALLRSMGGTPEGLVALRNLALAQIQEAKTNVYDITVVLKDFIVVLRNNITQTVQDLGDILRKGFQSEGGNYKSIRETLNPMFRSMRTGILDLSMEFIKLFSGLTSKETRLKELNDYLNAMPKYSLFYTEPNSGQYKLRQAYEEERDKLIKEVQQEKDALQRMEKEASEKKKTSSLEQFRRNQLRSFSPDDSGSALEIGNAQLAALERIEKNTYDQRRMTDMATRMSTLAMNLATNRVG